MTGPFIPLGQITQKSGKIVHAWASEGDIDCEKIASNSFEMEWPPRSGKRATFPEVDRAEFLTLHAAMQKINPFQIPLIERLVIALHASTGVKSAN